MKLFLVSEKFYAVPYEEASGLLVAAPDPMSAGKIVTTTGFMGNELENERSQIIPNVDIFELGDFIPGLLVTNAPRDIQESQQNGYVILEFGESCIYLEREFELRDLLIDNIDECNEPYAYSDFLSSLRKTHFSFQEKEGWSREDEKHFGITIPAWRSPEYLSHLELVIKSLS